MLIFALKTLLPAPSNSSLLQARFDLKNPKIAKSQSDSWSFFEVKPPPNLPNNYIFVVVKLCFLEVFWDQKSGKTSPKSPKANDSWTSFGVQSSNFPEFLHLPTRFFKGKNEVTLVFSVSWGSNTFKKGTFSPKPRRRVLIIGGSFSGLAAGRDLGFHYLVPWAVGVSWKKGSWEKWMSWMSWRDDCL